MKERGFQMIGSTLTLALWYMRLDSNTTDTRIGAADVSGSGSARRYAKSKMRNFLHDELRI